MICSILSDVVHSVLFPTFSRMQGDHENLKSAYLKTLEYVSFIAIFANLCILAVSKEFLYFILGHGTDKWLPALMALNILCIYGIIRALLEPVGNVILALGIPKLLAKTALFAGILELIFLYPALIYFGIEGVAIVVTAAYASQYVIYFPHLKRNYNLSFKERLSIKPAALSFIVVFVIIFIINIMLPSISFMTFLFKLTFCMTSYLLLYGYITKWKLIKRVTRAYYSSYKVPGSLKKE